MINPEKVSVTTSNANPNGPAAICVDHISKIYPVPFLRLKKAFRRKFKPPTEALRNVSFEVREGEIFGLIGPNGAGKTTLTKIIATLIQPTDGNVLVKGHDSVRDDEEVRRNVGLASAEERSFYWRLTAEQNLLFFARPPQPRFTPLDLRSLATTTANLLADDPARYPDTKPPYQPDVE